MTRSPFFADFPARLYLEKYYSRVGSENAAFFRAVASSLESVDELGTVVELGGGPSLSALFAMTAAANCGPTKVIWTDVAKSSHAEIELWLRRQSGAFEYSEVLRWIEDELGAQAATVARRIRAASWELRALDLFQPLPEDLLCIGDVVGSFFVAEAASSERDDFIAVTTRVAEAARPRARVTLAYIRRSRPYHLEGKQLYPAFSVDESNLPELLAEANLRLSEMRLTRGPTEEPPARAGYEGMVFVSGVVGA